MSGPGRPKNTKDLFTLVNKMLDKKDVVKEGKSISRREALIEMLWQRVWLSKGKDGRILHALLDFAGGKPVPMNQLPKEEDIQDTTIDDLLEIPDYIKDIQKDFEKRKENKIMDVPPEILKMINEIDLTKYMTEFEKWKKEDGSIAGLQAILDKQKQKTTPKKEEVKPEENKEIKT